MSTDDKYSIAIVNDKEEQKGIPQFVDKKKVINPYSGKSWAKGWGEELPKDSKPYNPEDHLPKKKATYTAPLPPVVPQSIDQYELDSLMVENQALSIKLRDFVLKNEDYDHKRKACETELKRKIGALEGDIQVEKKRFKDLETSTLPIHMANRELLFKNDLLRKRVSNLTDDLEKKKRKISKSDKELSTLRESLYKKTDEMVLTEKENQRLKDLLAQRDGMVERLEEELRTQKGITSQCLSAFATIKTGIVYKQTVF